MFKPNLTDRFKCYIDADWARTWLKTCPSDNTGALSDTAYLITYANCPIMWASKMQSLVALSTTEAKLIALSTTLHEVIHLQNLLLELCGCNFPIPFTKPQVVCCTMPLVLRLPNRITRSAQDQTYFSMFVPPL